MKIIQAAAILALAGLAGCASGASSHNMTASIAPALSAMSNSALYQSVVVGSVTGGQETDPMLMSKVANGEFKEALKGSLLQSHLHAIGPEKYTVSAEIYGLDQPIMGLDLSVTSKIRYQVIRNVDNAVVYDNVVSATHTATLGDSIVGVERLRLANEGSIKKNLQTFIAEVSTVKA